MNISCSKDLMLENLNIVMRAISSRTTMPILECVVIDAYDDSYDLLTSDSEMSIHTAPIPALVVEPGKIAVEFKMLYDIVKRIPDNDMNIVSHDNNLVIITSGKSEFKILGSDAGEYPAQPDVEKMSPYHVNAADFKKSIGQVIYSVSVDPAKPPLMGVLLETDGIEMRLVTVDGFRISYKKMYLPDGENSGNESTIVPADTMSELARIIGAGQDEILSIYITKSHILFETDAFTLISRTITGEFINYETMFKEDYKTKIVMKREGLLMALERVALIAARDAKRTPIRFSVEEERVVTTSNTEMGTAYDELRADTEGDNIVIAFNPRYVMDAVRSVEEDQVVMKLTTAMSPCIVRGMDDNGVENSNAKFLILPLRLKR